MNNISHEFMRRKFQARLDKIKAEFDLLQNTNEHWNRTHPEEEPLPIETWDEFLDSTGLRLRLGGIS